MSIARALRHRSASLLTVTSLFILSPGCGGEEVPHQAAEDSPVTAAPAAGGGAMTAAPVPGGAPRDPCQMISTEQVRAATDISAEGQPSTSGGAAVCTWSDASGRSAVVQVYPVAGRFADSRVAFESMFNSSAENLPDVGDEAYFIGGTMGSIPTATVGARRGDTPVNVQVMGMGENPATLRNQAIALTRTTLEQL